MVQMEAGEYKEYTVDLGLYEAVRRLIEDNEQCFKTAKIVIFGCGKTGRLVAEILTKMHRPIYGYIDNDVEKQNVEINSYCVYAPTILDASDDFQVIVGSQQQKVCREITGQLEEKGYRRDRNYHLLEFDADAELLEAVRQPRKSYIQFFGCCLYSSIAMEDIGRNTESLARMLEAALGRENTKLLALPGFSLREYYELLKMQIHMGNKPKGAVLIANMAQFMKRYQFLHDYSQHVELFEQLKQEFSIADSEYEAFLSDKRSRTESMQVRVAIKKADANVSERAARQKFKLKYMGEVETESEGCTYLEKLMDYCKQNRMKVLVVIAPVNYQYGQKVFGDKFNTYYDANVKLIQDMVGYANMDFLDCSYLYAEEDYPNPMQSDELGSCSGRQKIAEAVLSKLGEWEGL